MACSTTRRDVAGGPTLVRYGEDLAFIHAVGFGDFARRVGRAVLRLFRAHRIRDGLVVDLGCGNGTWARMLCDAGYAVVGVDTSRAMLRLARRAAPHARFVHGSLFSVALPASRAVTALGECVSYVDARPRSPGLAGLFHRVHAALEPGGLFVFDVIEEAPAAPRSVSAFGAEWATFVTTRRHPRGRVVRRITALRLVGERWRFSREVHYLRLHRRAHVRRLLESAGFRVHAASRFGREPLLPGRVGFIARRR